MRVLLAMVLALPIYFATDFGVLTLFIMGLQILAGLDFKFNSKERY